jgi:translation elongation factor EF-Tu-like GTPase
MNEEQIKNLSDGLNTANINNLLQYRQSDVISKVEILAAPDSCEKCKSQQGRIYTVEEAIKTRPLPCKDCNHEAGYCRCTYLPVIE